MNQEDDLKQETRETQPMQAKNWASPAPEVSLILPSLLLNSIANLAPI